MVRTVVIEVTTDDDSGDLTIKTTIPRRRGTVRWFSNLKGYGYIVPEDGGPEVFVHFSEIDTEEPYKTLTAGQDVEFTFGDRGKGPAAFDVKPLSTTNSYWRPQPEE